MQFGNSITFEQPEPGIFVVIVNKDWVLSEIEQFLEGAYKDALCNNQNPYVLIWDVSAVKGLVPAGTLGMIIRKAPTPHDESVREKGRYGVGASEFIKQMGMMAARMKHIAHKQKYFKTVDEAIASAKTVLATGVAG